MLKRSGEAVQRPTMRFVPIKSAEQQAGLLLHRARDLLIRQRSSLISAIRARFAEFGIVTSRGVRDIDRLLQLLTDTHTRLPELAREMLEVLGDQLREVAARVCTVEARPRLAPLERREPPACDDPGHWADHCDRYCCNRHRCQPI